MNRIRTWSRVAAVAGVVALVSQLIQPLPASAQWSAHASGAAAGGATTMPAGAKPSAGVLNGNVLVSWTAATMGNSVAVSGYIVRRYNAVNGTQATVGAGCAGVITATSCTEQSVPSGSWVYTDTPVQMNWTGAASAVSGTVSIP
jgi:hypothetical protein